MCSGVPGEESSKILLVLLRRKLRKEGVGEVLFCTAVDCWEGRRRTRRGHAEEGGENVLRGKESVGECHECYF